LSQSTDDAVYEQIEMAHGDATAVAWITKGLAVVGEQIEAGGVMWTVTELTGLVLTGDQVLRMPFDARISTTSH
jgi:hypothetical protein